MSALARSLVSEQPPGEGIAALLAQPRGFCAGVVRAIKIVEVALEMYGAPVYVYHEIVHNRHVVEDLKSKGAVFVQNLDGLQAGSVLVFSAHGVSNAIVRRARALQLTVVDATCPLVAKVHLQAQNYIRQGYELVMIGHSGHEEVEGTVGSVDRPVHVVSSATEVETVQIAAAQRVAYVTQTTLSLDDTKDVIAALKRRFPAIQGPELDDICYATQNRQRAVRQLAQQVDMLLVVGAHNSSNSIRLCEVAKQQGVPAYLVQDEGDLDADWFLGVKRVGVSAAASAPEAVVQRLLHALREFGLTTAQELAGEREAMHFSLPKELLRASATKNGTALDVA